ncbi:small nuclear ribonucleoprotein Sm D3-like isoform X2 [Argiope bruennichi]|uniref:small nuclear ribonucleoprotein Sm D3-like isoform X2 n=1 Tax=Argiope bruennichi TaxID=94029 RepID=UPI00249553B7|nr:small nuclear ribonucleoprotein Sm D3-like isoform X2 [Argiope bruennichi]
MDVGVPTQLLQEAEGEIISVEVMTGEEFRGKLIKAQNNNYCILSDVTVTYKSGFVRSSVETYLRWKQIRFIILPEKINKLLREMALSGAQESIPGKTAILPSKVCLVPSTDAEGKTF